MTEIKATFAAGCFWGVQESFDRLPGVLATRVGYIGGTITDPNYEEVCTGKTGHAEAVELIFDQSQISFRKLVDFFWTIHDPTTLNRQGVDVGSQYRSAVFFHDAKQEAEALASKKAQSNHEAIVTEIEAATEFYPAEEYHQKYFEKNPGSGCRI